MVFGRADKIGLIVAALLVVLLAAGTGFLLSERGSNATTGAPSASVPTFAPLPGETTASAGSTPARSAKRTVPKRPAGSVFGFVTKVGKSGLSLRWDLADLVTGTQADLYAQRKGKLVRDKLFYVANDTHKIVIYDVSPKAAITVAGARGKMSRMKPAEFKRRYDAAPAKIRAITWFAWVAGGTVTRLTQVVLPSADLQQ